MMGRWRRKRSGPQPTRAPDWPGLVLLSALFTDALEECEASLRQGEAAADVVLLDGSGLEACSQFAMEWDFGAGRPVAAIESECGFEPSPDFEAPSYRESQDILFGFLQDPNLTMQLLMPLSGGAVDWLMPSATLDARRGTRMYFDAFRGEEWPEPLPLQTVHAGYALETQFPKRGLVTAELSPPTADSEAGIFVWTTHVTIEWEQHEEIASHELGASFWSALRDAVSRIAPRV